MELIQKIQQEYPSFSHKEKLIADYLLQNATEIKNINIADLAELTESSPATITRFSKKVGVENFVDLKMKINSHVGETNEQESELLIANEILKYYSEVIEETNKLTNKKYLEEVIKLISSANRIYILGIGNSGLTAKEFSYRLLRMGLTSSAILDSHIMLMQGAILDEKDLIIAVSSSGETAEIIASLELAKNNKVKIVALTSFINSSIAKISDVTLLSYYSKFINNERFVNSQFALIYIIDIITTLLMENKEFRNNMNQTINTITK